MAVRYITTADVVKAMPAYLRLQLFDDDHSGAEDVGLVDTIIESAADWVDGYLGTRYEVPAVGTVPSTVKTWTLRAFRYMAHERLSKVTDLMQQQYEMLVDELNRVRKGDISVGLTPLPAERSNLAASISSQTRVFSRTTMGGVP